jgi:hypothetical protein
VIDVRFERAPTREAVLARDGQLRGGKLRFGVMRAKRFQSLPGKFPEITEMRTRGKRFLGAGHEKPSFAVAGRPQLEATFGCLAPAERRLCCKSRQASSTLYADRWPPVWPIASLSFSKRMSKQMAGVITARLAYQMRVSLGSGRVMMNKCWREGSRVFTPSRLIAREGRF